jgi:hypothetical protein
MRIEGEGKKFPSRDLQQLINLYTSAGYLKEYERTGHFVLPYSVDHPLSPVLEVINNSEYTYYQKFL